MDTTKEVLVGQTLGVSRLRQQIERAGRNNWPVLLLGETGTGKEVVARQVHAVRNHGPFVTVDCSSLVSNLIESELFGHQKGAFTGASSDKIGLIEAAHGGTAFFDEVGELPLDMQSKLLRVLQLKEFRPVGSTRAKHSDFRVIAATNRDLAAEVEKGQFRSDLFYRLTVVTVRLQPLRERRDDIPLLVAHFLKRYGDGHRVTQEVMDVLLSYGWPGNVRELEHCIQRLVAFNSGPLIHTGELPSMLVNQIQQQRGHYLAASAGGGTTGGGSAATLIPETARMGMGQAPVAVPLRLSEVEKRAIAEALRYTKGDRATAAQLLGIGRTTLYRKLKEYSLDQRVAS